MAVEEPPHVPGLETSGGQKELRGHDCEGGQCDEGEAYGVHGPPTRQITQDYGFWLRAQSIRIDDIMISVMRATVPSRLPILRSELQAHLLSRILLSEDRRWTPHDLAVALDAPSASVHRELRRALEAGLIERDASVRPHSYAPATESPLYPSIRDLLRLTYGVEAELTTAIGQIEGVDAAVIHGSWAEGRAGPGSDIDVLLVGAAEFDRALGRLQRVGKTIGRRVDMTLVTPSELRRLHEDDNGFLRKILEGRRIPLAGDLESMVPTAA